MSNYDSIRNDLEFGRRIFAWLARFFWIWSDCTKNHLSTLSDLLKVLCAWKFQVEILLWHPSYKYIWHDASAEMILRSLYEFLLTQYGCNKVQIAATMWMFHIDVQSVIHDKNYSREYKFARDVSIHSIPSNRTLSNI